MNQDPREILVAPKQERSRKTKENILATAEEIFAQKGLHGARIDEIANLATVNKQRIYAYFGSKQDLYRQVLLSGYSQAASDQRIASLSEEDIPHLTSRLLDMFFNFHKNHPRFWRLLAWENLNGGKSLRKSDWAGIRGSYIEHLKSLYLTAQKQGCFRKEIHFSSYLVMVFSVTYFYYSNQITMSHLLEFNLSNKRSQKKLGQDLGIILDFGIQAKKDASVNI